MNLKTFTPSHWNVWCEVGTLYNLFELKQNFLYSQRLFAKHRTRSSLCRIFHGRSLSYKFVFNSIQFFVYCCHSNVDFTSKYILSTLNPKSIGDDNFIVIGFFTILKSLKGRLKKTGMLKGYDFPMESTKGVPFLSLTFFFNRFFLQSHT